MTMRWFGHDLGAPIYQDSPQAETPVGRPCSRCSEPIQQGEDGFLVPVNAVFFFHRACFLRGIVGSIAHQTKTCSCYFPGEAEPDDLSVREEAALAVAYWERNG